MKSLIVLSMASGLISAACNQSQPTPLANEGAEQSEQISRPDRAAILRQTLACGLREENLEFSVDAEGVDNADIFPTVRSDPQFNRSVECMMEWAAETGAALGFHSQPRDPRR